MPDQESIWAESAAGLQGAEGLHELGLGEEWARDYIEHAELDVESDKLQETAQELVENVTDPKFQYSKVNFRLSYFFVNFKVMFRWIYVTLWLSLVYNGLRYVLLHNWYVYVALMMCLGYVYDYLRDVFYCLRNIDVMIN